MSNGLVGKVIRTDRIVCPGCIHPQDAQVQDGMMFPVFVHFCENCDYIILESEWDIITPEEEAELLEQPE